MPPSDCNGDWDEAVDFLVVGSGGGAMTAAIRAHDLGASTLILEKAGCYGGSTALSGGVIWVPDNPLMRQAGIDDSREAALRYLEAVTAGSSNRERLEAYVETAPRMMRYLLDHTRMRFELMSDYPDYYPELPGGKAGGRSCEPAPFSALKLGDEFQRQNLHPLKFYVLGFLTTKASEGKPMMKGGLRGQWLILRKTLAYGFNIRARLRGRRNTQLTLGGAIIGSARRSLMDRGVPLWLNTRLEDLVVQDGRAIGAVASREGRPLRIRANKGLLLSTGGFERNASLRQKHQQAPIGDRWTAGTETNTGDAIAIGERIGAELELLDDAWWCPTFAIPGESRARVVIFERSLPGSILVDTRGERFMNEAAPYNEAVKTIYAKNSDRASTIPAYLIFDRSFRKKYAVGPVYPASMMPDGAIRGHLKGWMKKDSSLAGLAAQIGVDPGGLAKTVERFNDFARRGKDEDFGRGESAQDRYYSVRPPGPNPNLAEIAKPPFYAVEVWPGDLGTKGGLRTDASARVLSRQGEVIPGLYATGNCSAAVMGHAYPGAGGTIGPAMTFGFIAAEHAVGGG